MTYYRSSGCWWPLPTLGFFLFACYFLVIDCIISVESISFWQCYPLILILSKCSFKCSLSDSGLIEVLVSSLWGSPALTIPSSAPLIPGWLLCCFTTTLCTLTISPFSGFGNKGMKVSECKWSRELKTWLRLVSKTTMVWLDSANQTGKVTP